MLLKAFIVFDFIISGYDAANAMAVAARGDVSAALICTLCGCGSFAFGMQVLFRAFPRTLR